MKNFVEYINVISANPILPKKAKVTTTILMPELDTTEGIYRSLLPSYVVNGDSKDLRILIVGMTAKMNVSNNAKNWMITRALIAETDIFVFPFTSCPLRPVIDEIKAVKPFVKFMYYIDVNFYLMPEAYPYAKEYTLSKMVDIIEDNIKAMDYVIVTNEALREYILDRFKERYHGETIKTLFLCQQLFILPELMKTEYTNGPEKGKIKALIIGDEYQFSDINFIKGILKDFKCKYKEAAEVHILGWDGMRSKRNYLQGLDFKTYPRVTFSKYFEMIKHIGPDVLIIPANNSKFNETSKNYIKYLEFAHLNIPVIAPNIKTYSKLITNNVNGFLCTVKEDYMFQLETMFTEPAKSAGTLGLAYATASEKNILEEGNLKIIEAIYFPEYGK